MYKNHQCITHNVSLWVFSYCLIYCIHLRWGTTYSLFILTFHFYCELSNKVKKKKLNPFHIKNEVPSPSNMISVGLKKKKRTDLRLKYHQSETV